MSEIRGNMVEITCKCGCGRKRMVREADRKRGWGKYFDKSCKAKHQEKRTGQYAAYLHGGRGSTSFDMVDDDRGFSVYGESWDEHKHD